MSTITNLRDLLQRWSRTPRGKQVAVTVEGLERRALMSADPTAVVDMSASADPGEVAFSPDGRFLLVTHKVSDVDSTGTGGSNLTATGDSAFTPNGRQLVVSYKGGLD